MAHWSDCAVNNALALPVGPCNCGNDAPVAAPTSWCFSDEMLERYPNGAGATVAAEGAGDGASSYRAQFHRLNFGKLD